MNVENPLIRGRLSSLLRSLSRSFAAVALVLAACGGTPDALVVDTPAPDASSPTTPTVPATALAGLYKGALGSNPKREFLALVVPASEQTVQVYGWYFGAADPHLAHLYSGQLALGVQGVAANVAQSWKVSEGIESAPFPATANISAGSLSHLLADISISRSSPTNYRLAADSLSSDSYQFDAPPAALHSSLWDGYWSSKTNTIGGRLAFGPQGLADVSGSLWECFRGHPPLTWSWTAQSFNYFKVTLSLGPITLCRDWENRTLQGVAVVSKQNGVDQLDMMLLDGTGAGISYRGTRSVP